MTLLKFAIVVGHARLILYTGILLITVAALRDVLGVALPRWFLRRLVVEWVILGLVAEALLVAMVCADRYSLMR